MSRSRKEEQEPYTPPLPKSRALDVEYYQAAAARVWGLSCQLYHVADVLNAYGWAGSAAQLRSAGRELQIQSRAMAGLLVDSPLPTSWEAEETYWHGRTRDGLRVIW